MKSSKIYFIQKILFVLSIVIFTLLIVLNMNENIHNLFVDNLYFFVIFNYCYLMIFINTFSYYINKIYHYIVFIFMCLICLIHFLIFIDIIELSWGQSIAILGININLLPFFLIISILILAINFKKIKLNYRESKEEYLDNKGDIKNKLINSVGVPFANIVNKCIILRNKIKDNKIFKIAKRTLLIILIIVIYNYLTQMFILCFSGFTNVDWNSSAEESLYFGINSSYSYVDFGAGAPVWNSDICYGYSYNPFTKTIKLKCKPFYELDKEDKIIKVVKVDRKNGILILQHYNHNFTFYEDASVFYD